MTQFNNTPTMGKFSWKATSRTPRKRKEGEVSGEGDLGKEITPQMIDIKSSGPVGTDPASEARDSQHEREEKLPKEMENGTNSALPASREAEEGEIIDEEEQGVRAATQRTGEETNNESGSPLRRSSRINMRSEEELASDSHSSSTPASPQPATTSGEPSKRVRIHTSNMHQCTVCGKMYKHRNCLTKHAWEHHESWNLTKKWCQTKHQQVQMLEAAQALTEMTLLTEMGMGGGRSAGIASSKSTAPRKGTIPSY